MRAMTLAMHVPRFSAHGMGASLASCTYLAVEVGLMQEELSQPRWHEEVWPGRVDVLLASRLP